ncbi:MAG: 4Fe-4S dicluster domain-containing protein, partial [Spirochaetales bacterium]|nr:4Fe-4S dicluster domain-containing protein [Spirochaetales bacterium]
SAGEPSVIAPPGALSVRRFLASCTACHLCVSKCPTGVLQPSLLSSGLRGVLQPRMDYRSGNCDYQCNLCSQVCPSGALLPLSLKEKQETRIGTAEFVLERCVVLTNGTVCGACAEICPTSAVRMVPYRGALRVPAVEAALCIGCGSCEYVCPAVPQRAITVRSAPRHERIDLAGTTRVEETEPQETEGGFAF